MIYATETMTRSLLWESTLLLNKGESRIADSRSGAGFCAGFFGAVRGGGALRLAAALGGGGGGGALRLAAAFGGGGGGGGGGEARFAASFVGGGATDPRLPDLDLDLDLERDLREREDSSMPREFRCVMRRSMSRS